MMSEEVKQEPAISAEAVPSAAVPGDMPAEGPKLDPSKEHHENIYDMLMKEDEITWQSIIKELIKNEEMDPWDINISLLSKMFIKTLKKLKEMNLHVSGKVLLCAALLLRIKSSRLVGDDLLEFDRLLASGENNELYEGEEGFVEGELGQMGVTIGKDQMKLIPKTPQPRKRKVSVYDLIDALAVALNVKRRRILNQIQVRTKMGLPEKKIDLSLMMGELYDEVVAYLTSEQANNIAFSNLVPSDSKQDKVYTFVPLLHLTNARKVDLTQNNHFGEIWVSLAAKDASEKKAAKQAAKDAEEKVVEAKEDAPAESEKPEAAPEPAEEEKKDEPEEPKPEGDVSGPADEKASPDAEPAEEPVENAPEEPENEDKTDSASS